MRQPAVDRARYYREIRRTLLNVIGPEVVSAQGKDAVGLIERILVEYVVEEEYGTELSAEFGDRLHRVLHNGEPPSEAVTNDEFHRLRRLADLTIDDSLTQELARIELEFLERQYSLWLSVAAESLPAAAPVWNCSVTSDQVQHYLRRRYPSSPELRVTDLRLLPGGRSKETILVSLDNTTELPPEFVIKKDRLAGFLLPTHAADDFKVLEVVHAYGGVPCPEPFFAEHDPALLGGTFIAMGRARGIRAGDQFPEIDSPAEHRHEIMMDFARSLARIHTMPLHLLANSGIDVAPPPLTRERVSETIRAIEAKILETPGDANICVRLACRWLVDNANDGVVTTAPCLNQGDIGLHNTMIEGGRITALVDWELPAVKPAVMELSTLIDTVQALTTWEQFVAEYVAAGGNAESCDLKPLLFYRLQRFVWAYMLTRGMAEVFRNGSRRDIVSANSALDSQFRHARNVARGLRDVTALAAQTA